MTTDRLAPGSRASAPGGDERAQDGLPATTILSMCDRLLGEVGRRHHMFAWLRAPGAGSAEWLAVDAYYPRNRLVVMCRSRPGEHDALYRELIPGHGLKFLALDPRELGNDRGTVEAALAATIFRLQDGPRRERLRPRMPRPGPAVARSAPTSNGARPDSAQARTSPAAPVAAPPVTSVAMPEPEAPPLPPPAVEPEPTQALELDFTEILEPEREQPEPEPVRAPAPDGAPARRERRPPAPGGWGPVKRGHGALAQGLLQVLGVILGLAFAGLLIGELYLGLVRVAFIEVRVLLALGIVIDACARALGTVAAERAGRRVWALGCAIVGSPVVIIFTLLRPSGRVKVEPAPLAGVLSLIACALAVAGLLIGH
jgi:hypothetical protein